MTMIIARGTEKITFVLPGLKAMDMGQLESQGIRFHLVDSRYTGELKVGDVTIEFIYDLPERERAFGW